MEATRSRIGGTEIETKGESISDTGKTGIHDNKYSQYILLDWTTLSGVRPIIIEESSTFNVTIPEGYSLSVFAIGGGASGYTHRIGGSRGSFQHLLVDNHTNQSTLELTVNIGEGGRAGRSGGSTTIGGLPEYFSAQGGSIGECGCRSMEALPHLCDTSLTWGVDGTGSQWDTSNGIGGGIVDGRKPIRELTRQLSSEKLSCQDRTIDGEGFGAGGGYNSYGRKKRYRNGNHGVAVLTLCKSV